MFTFPFAVFCIRFGRDDYVNFRRAEIVHKPLGGARKSFPYHAIAGYYFDPRNTEHGVFEVQTRQGYKARFVPGMYNCVYVGRRLRFGWIMGIGLIRYPRLICVRLLRM